ncbi:SERINE/THREONINE RECEPTOR-LIKE KINASE NFP [Salix koriyanagi]|uniref:SERINE/THREONINE RECEPTOR-LIKE KINASE NFP n=1 Tax=Salix koriyanagi TaxID=2511006 RepID=A0A9Q0UMP0_9ROSI|nr:SERINE/THREONINE RECEPTOR-LIKE KINASE NFP [Salix koriyanagi]
MAISLLSFFLTQALLLLVLVFFSTYVTAQTPPGTVFSCPIDSPTTCSTYISYLAQPPNFMDLGKISNLFGISGMIIARASNLESEDTPLFPNQLLLVPVSCGCTGNQSFANITYQIQKGDSYYSVSTSSFENLTRWQEVEALNSFLKPTLLEAGDRVMFPLLCKCPSRTHLENGIGYLITYVWQPGDDLENVAAKFNASERNIVKENNYDSFTAAVYHPILIPVSNFPVLKKERRGSKNLWIIIVPAGIASTFFTCLLVAFLIHKQSSYKAIKGLDRTGSSLETSYPIQMKEIMKLESIEAKIKPDKLLPGVSGYLDKPIMYEVKEIMEGTMDLHEHYKIGGSVYRANINGCVLAVKKTKDDVTEELKILQKVSHANLVKLMGLSSESDREGNRFLVYEYAENGSLDKWLHPKSESSSSSVGFLTWKQRMGVALDVANGLQYMHEHTQPRTVHKDIRTSNILLDSTFRAKIANFSMARTATDSMMPKEDVFDFGVVLLELLSGKKAMVTKENGEIVLLCREIKDVLEMEEKREERLRKWMDPSLERFYQIDSAMSLATLARLCTLESSSERPSMAEIVFNLTVLTQPCRETLERWTSVVETEDFTRVIGPVTAR